MRLRFSSMKDKELFLKYAIPCGNVLVRRKSIGKAKLNKIRSDLLKGKDVKGIEKIFVIASNMCYITAKKMKKKRIDKAVIRRYFWHEHSKAIDWRKKIYRDFDPKLCKIYPGKVIKISKVNKKVLVNTPISKRQLRSDFIADLVINDLVTVHYDYIVEKITRGEFKRLWNKYK